MAIHIVMWNLRPELLEDQRVEAVKNIKEKLEALVGVVPGLMDAKVIKKQIETCTREILLICEFEKVEDIISYQVHPAHQEVASYVRTVTCDRVCFDYES